MEKPEWRRALCSEPYHRKPRTCPPAGRVSWCATMGLIGLIRLIGQLIRYALPVRGRDNQPIITPLSPPAGLQPGDRRLTQPPSGGTHQLPLACRALARRQAPSPTAVRRNPPTTSRLSGIRRTTGAPASGLISGALSRRYSRVLPRSPRQARTHVRNWSGDDRKARESKRERPVYHKTKV